MTRAEMTKGTLAARGLPVLLRRIEEGEWWWGRLERLSLLDGTRTRLLRADLDAFCTAAASATPGARPDVDVAAAIQDTLTLWPSHHALAGADRHALEQTVIEVLQR